MYEEKRWGIGLIWWKEGVRDKESNTAWYIKKAIKPLLLEVRRSGLCKLEDCKDEEFYKHLKTNEPEKRGIKKN